MSIRLKIFGFLHFKSNNKNKGDVLISYITLPFTNIEESLDAHTNRWECKEIVNTFLNMGYNVDLIDWKNREFIPRKKYYICMDIHDNLDRISRYLNKDCIKIFYATGAHWLFQNHAEYSRLFELQTRRGFSLTPRRIVSPALSLNHADFLTIIGNEFTEGTYSSINVPKFPIKISSTHIYKEINQKDFDAVRNQFIWFGGSGMVHKGLDLVLEAFTQMPEFQLFVIGKVEKETDFFEAYKNELCNTANIKYVGPLDPSSQKFLSIVENSLGLVFPSCSEGSSGGVITTMHAGLIPIISYESGISIRECGIILKENNISEIKNAVRYISSLDKDQLKSISNKCRDFALLNHTRDNFSDNFRNSIEKIIADTKKTKNL